MNNMPEATIPTEEDIREAIRLTVEQGERITRSMVAVARRCDISIEQVVDLGDSLLVRGNEPVA